MIFLCKSITSDKHSCDRRDMLCFGKKMTSSSRNSSSKPKLLAFPMSFDASLPSGRYRCFTFFSTFNFANPHVRAIERKRKKDITRNGCREINMADDSKSFSSNTTKIFCNHAQCRKSSAAQKGPVFSSERYLTSVSTFLLTLTIENIKSYEKLKKTKFKSSFCQLSVNYFFMQSNVNFSVCLVFSKEWSLSFKAMLGYDKTERSMQARSRLSVFGLFLGGGGGGGGISHFGAYIACDLNRKLSRGPGVCLQGLLVVS